MKTYNMAILGCGSIAEYMARTLNNIPRMNLYAAASRSLERAQAFAGTWGADVAYGSYGEMLQDENVDIVYVATPHSEHYENVKLCFAHGKAVLCEKAFTGNARQAEDILAISAEKGIFITEAIWPRYMPIGKKIRELVDGGAIGEPALVEANLGFPLTHVPRMTEPELAGGALLDLGVYPLTFASIVFGSNVDNVTATAVLSEKGVDTQNSITLEYPGNRLAVLYSTMLGPASGEGRVYGSKGSIWVESINGMHKAELRDLDKNVVETLTSPEHYTGYEYEVEACIEALDNNWLEHPDMPHSETLRIMRLMDSLREQFGVVYPFD